MNELALFAGAGGGILGGHLLGWRTICAVERDPFARDILLARQNDRSLPPFPIWDDVQTFDGRPWRGRADVVSGGFPCQDISLAGKGRGIDGERSGLWGHMARIIRDVRPRFAFVENSPALTLRGLDRVLADLAEMGFDAEWCVLGAHHTGAPHKRARIWILAHPNRKLRAEDDAHGSPKSLAGTQNLPCSERPASSLSLGRGGIHGMHRDQTRGSPSSAWDPEHEPQRLAQPSMGGVVDGLACWMDRLRCAGNGQVPAVAALAWRTLIARIM